ncbi:MAG: hypothetical protein AAF619_12620 [Pseudomonadota bacterium]
MRALLAHLPIPAIAFLTYGALVVFVLAIVNWYPSMRPSVLSEDGWIEVGSLYLSIFAGVLFLFGRYDYPTRKWMIAAICFLFAAREFDINLKIARQGFAFFPDDFKGINPVGYAIVETLAVIGIVLLVVAIIWTYWRAYVENLKARDWHQVLISMVWFCVGLSLLVDSADNKVEAITGARPTTGIVASFSAVEEASELMIPIFLIFGFFEFQRSRFLQRRHAYRLDPPALPKLNPFGCRT